VKDLIDKLEAAEAGSRELDIALGQALGLIDAGLIYTNPDGSRSARGNCDPWQDWTDSLDAALALAERVLPGWCWNGGNDVGCWADIWSDSADYDGMPFSGRASSLALSTCIAILQAKEAQS
jgi:hypothetical protein